jgi:hypothetical protein
VTLRLPNVIPIAIIVAVASRSGLCQVDAQQKVIADAPAFCDAYTSYKENNPLLPKGEFESSDDYARRASEYPTGKIDVSFTLPPSYDSLPQDAHVAEALGLTGRGVERQALTSSYDTDTNTLTIFASDQPGDHDGGFSPKGATAILIAEKDSTDAYQYEAENAMGAQVTVSASNYYEYVLYIHNMGKLPKNIFYQNGSHFVLILNKTETEAKAIIEHGQVVIDVSLYGYDNCWTGLADSEKPTFDDPRDVSWYRTSIEADIRDVKLLDEKGQVILEYNIQK